MKVGTGFKPRYFAKTSVRKRPGQSGGRRPAISSWLPAPRVSRGIFRGAKEFLFARLAADLDGLTLVDKRDLVAHRVEVAVGHQADLQRIRLGWALYGGVC